jgi:hypothetical protein
MESKLNYEAIDTYVKAYSSKLNANLFAEKEMITGDEIFQLSVSQVGLFVLNKIYQSWAFEADKLKSPYFNYQSDAVHASMQKLMNVLSKNILVSKGDFEPMLTRAVHDTILLLISPYSYYKILLEKDDTNFEVLQAMDRFVIINKGVLSNMIDKLSSSAELINDSEALLNAVFSSLEDAPQNNDPELQKFAEIHPLIEEDFYLAEAEAEAEEPVIQTHEFDDEEDEEDLASENTLNDSFVSSSYETVADKLKSSQQVNTLKSMLSINQKFMFINDLFNDSQEDFNKVLDFLESCDTKEAAVSFINNNYLKHNIWNANAPQVKEFLGLLEKKFA